MPKRKVEHAFIRYHKKNSAGRRGTYFARHGDVVDLPQYECDRLEQFDAVSRLDEGKRKDKAPPELLTPEGEVDANALANATVPEVVEFVSKRPDLADQVADVEENDGQARKGVLALRTGDSNSDPTGDDSEGQGDGEGTPEPTGDDGETQTSGDVTGNTADSS